MNMYKKIVRAEIKFPQHFSSSACSLVSQLLNRKCARRLGVEGGPSKIKEHPWFFENLSWKTLAAQGYKAPIVPKVKDDFDVSNFPDSSPDDGAEPIESVVNYESDVADWDAAF